MQTRNNKNKRPAADHDTSVTTKKPREVCVDSKGTTNGNKAIGPLPLDDIIKAKPNQVTLRELCNQLRTKGWCFVKLPTGNEYKSLTLSTENYQQLEDFFARDMANKREYSAPLSFGYFNVEGLKEGMHMYTGNRISEHKMPPSLSSMFNNWSKSCDALGVELVYALAQPLFNATPFEVYRDSGLPLSQVSEQLGLLDVARYYNTKKIDPSPEIGAGTEDVNCVPHFDPGLLSMSFFSNTPGLQLLDPNTKQWVGGPVNTDPQHEGIAVIWTGEAAVTVSKGAVNPGTHRVVYPTNDTPTIPRVGIWYEMATIQQINSVYARLTSLEGVTEITVENATTSKGKGAKVKVEPGDTIHTVFRKIEKHYGMPSEKSGMMSVVRTQEGRQLFKQLSAKEKQVFEHAEKHLQSTFNDMF